MNLQHLRYLLAVSRTGSFTAAASAMFVTQPTISSGIAELESELGVQLFNRNGRQVELTIEGRALLNYATRIQDLVEEAGDRISKRTPAQGGGFQIGAIDAAVIYLLPSILRSYLGAHPNVELSVQVAPSRYLAEDLLMNRSEFAILTMPFDHPRLQTLTLHRDHLVLVVGAAHSFADRKTVTLEQVAREPLILFHDDSVSRRIVDEKFAEAGVSARVVMAMRSPEAMRKLVEAGVGISFLPSLTVADALQSGELKEVGVKGIHFTREMGLAWKSGRYFGPAINDLLSAIVNEFGKGAAFRKARSE
jgi:LysR family transcriptional regulator, low CO2-responsive transcriptional regulator